MSRRGWIALIAVTLLVAAIAYQNRFERAALALGPLSVYAVPLVLLLLLAFILGMGTMLLVSLSVDRQNRELLRAHGLLDAPPPTRPADPAYASPAVDPDPPASPDPATSYP